MSSLRDALTDSGFAEVNFVPLTEATRAWAMSAGRENGQQTTGLCVLGRDSASLSVINTHSGAIESADDDHVLVAPALVDWLNSVDRGTTVRGRRCLYLIGPRSDSTRSAVSSRIACRYRSSQPTTRSSLLPAGAAFSNVSSVDEDVVGRPGPGFVSGRTDARRCGRDRRRVVGLAVVGRRPNSRGAKYLPAGRNSVDTHRQPRFRRGTPPSHRWSSSAAAGRQRLRPYPNSPLPRR